MVSRLGQAGLRVRSSESGRQCPLFRPSSPIRCSHGRLARIHASQIQQRLYRRDIVRHAKGCSSCRPTEAAASIEPLASTTDQQPQHLYA